MTFSALIPVNPTLALNQNPFPTHFHNWWKRCDHFSFFYFSAGRLVPA
jgi:hypothetical protein